MNPGRTTPARRIDIAHASALVARAKLNAPIQIAHPTDEQLDARPCAKGDPERFFSEDRVIQLMALVECWGCPLRSRCLETALKLRQTDKGSGVWGATTAMERRAIVRRRAREVAA